MARMRTNLPAKLSACHQASVVPKARQRPALVKNTSGFLLEMHAVGEMVFDPERKCWLGNESELQNFDFDSDIEPVVATGPCRRGLRIRRTTRRSD